MKNPLWKIILLLIITYIVLSAYSFTEYQVTLGSWELEKTPTMKSLFYQYFEVKDDTIREYCTESFVEDSVPVVVDIKPILDTASQRVLLIGDSMLEGLMLRLKDYIAYNGHDIKTVIWYSSSTKIFGSSDTLRYFIKQWKPTYVILVLGANELFVRDIIEKNQHYVENILAQMDTLKYVWIGPPNWREDTGINELILKNVGDSKYYPSKNLVLKRSRDGAHPTHDAASVWMDSIANWVMTKSLYPILLNKPDTIYRRTANVTILQPLR